MNDRFYERFFFNFFCVFFLLLSTRASAANVTHSVDVRVVIVGEELQHLARQNDRFKIAFSYDNDVVSRPPFYDKNGVYSGPQHKYKRAAQLIKIERYTTNIGSLSFNNIESFELARITTEPPTGSFRAAWKSEKNGGVRVFIEFRDVDLKVGDSPIFLKNQLLESLNNSSGIFNFQFENGESIRGVFSE